MTIRKLR